MEPIKKYYEGSHQLMPKLRPLVVPTQLNFPFQKLMNKKWRKTLNEQGKVKLCNEYAEAFLNSGHGPASLYYVADLLHKLNLSVSFEMFKTESGYHLFEESLILQKDEMRPFFEREDYDKNVPAIIYKLGEFIDYQNHFRNNDIYVQDMADDGVNAIWEQLHLWPALEGHKRPVRRGRAEYDEFIAVLNSPIFTSTPNKKRTKYRKMRDYSQEMHCPPPRIYRGEPDYHGS